MAHAPNGNDDFTNASAHADSPFHIAIIGGGISGCVVAIALQRRGIHTTIYERANAFGEIGAGLAFNPAAARAMVHCDPRIHEKFESIASKNLWASKAGVWFDWLDGYHDYGMGVEGTDGQVRQSHGADAERNGTDAHGSHANHATKGPGDKFVGGEKWMFDIIIGGDGHGVHRARFLEQLEGLIAPGSAQFGKSIDSITEDSNNGRMVMTFQDGSSAVADAVIGCDGIRSRVRQIIVGEKHPSAHPVYTHKYAYRGLIPMDKAIEALGEDRAVNAKMHTGPDGHILTFPVNQGKVMNVVAFKHDYDDWKHAGLTTPSTIDAVQKDYGDWSPSVKKLCSLLSPQLDCWAIFDTGEHPLEQYNKGRVCLLGDAAHASSPHHGAGAGMCIEDAAVMATILKGVARWATQQSAEHSVASQHQIDEWLTRAFEVFDGQRRERTQWLVQSSRLTGNLYDWKVEGIGGDAIKMHAELEQRCNIIWTIDTDEMIRRATAAINGALA